MISLVYSELLKKYNEILISTSRGFDTEYEFLEYWVPSTDINQSISDLVNSAIDFNITKLEIIFTKEEINDLYFKDLKKKFYQYETFDLTKNKIVFCAKKNKDYSKN